MEYTENYQFREPTPAVDIVKIGDINYNSRKIDELIHSTQVSLAPAYDATRTSENPYMTGDVVMKDALMYRCLEDDVYGAWDATKWERTTAGEEGAGGSNVEANPQGTPTDDLDTIGINGTIYNIAGSGGGGGNVYGAFIDTNNLISRLEYTNDAQIPTYTATEDCFVSLYVFGKNTNTCAIDINSANVSQMYFQGDSEETAHLYLKRGQTLDLTISGYYNVTLRIYGLTFGTQNIFTPQIYSTEERCIGVWTDNKPLYQKTFIVENITVSNTYGIDVSALDVDFGMGCKDSSFYFVNGLVRQDMNVMYESGTPNCLYIVTPVSRNIQKGYFTMIYTKTTDTAGRGSYNTLGVPMVHYSTDEQVVGTWIDGKTIYQKTCNVTTNTNCDNTTWTSLPLDNPPANADYMVDAELHGQCPNTNRTYRFQFENGAVKIASLTSEYILANTKITFRYTKSQS